MGKVSVEHDWSSQNWLAPDAPVTESLTDNASASDAVAKFVGAVSPVTVSLSDAAQAADAVTATDTGSVTPDWEDDFTSYTDTTDYRSDPNGWYVGLPGSSSQFIDTSETFDGHQTVRFDFSGREDSGSPCSDTFIGLTQNPGNVLSKTITEVWLEASVKMDPHFDSGQYHIYGGRVTDASGFQVGEGLSFSGGHTATLRHTATIPGVSDVLLWSQISDENNPPANGDSVTGDTSGASQTLLSSDQGCTDPPDHKALIYGTRASGTANFRYGFNMYSQPNRNWLIETPGACTTYASTDCVSGQTKAGNGQRIWVRNAPPPVGNCFHLNDGSWHTLQLYANIPSSSCATDGEVLLIVDGTVVMHSIDIETDSDTFNELRWFSNINGPMQDQSMWVGHIQLWCNGNDPGWTGVC